MAFLEDLVARKLAGKEKGTLEPGERDTFVEEAKRLEAELERAAERSSLPEDVRNRAALEDFLIRLRLERREKTT